MANEIVKRLQQVMDDLAEAVKACAEKTADECLNATLLHHCSSIGIVNAKMNPECGICKHMDNFVCFVFIGTEEEANELTQIIKKCTDEYMEKRGNFQPNCTTFTKERIH